MKHTYYCTLKGAFLVLALPLALASCSFDGDYDDCAEAVGDVKTVRLQIMANDPDEVAGTRFSPAEGDIIGNERGTDGEYINSLDIFIVSPATSANVVYASHLNAAKLGGDAAKGNLTSYTSEPIELTDGTPYTVYAFANMSGTYASAWRSSVASIDKGGTLTASTLNDIMLDDPAGKLDFNNGNFIPMSASYEITSLASPVIEVGLDRLVSKIRLAIKKAENVNVTSLKISGWADKVPLMNDATVSGEAYDCEKTISDPVLKADGGTYSMEDFYVNESPKGHNFNVEVTTDEPGTPVYTATTARDNIPRNCIYPLTLNLNECLFDIAAECWIAPLGAYVPVNVNFDDNTFHITLPNLCTFQFTGSLMKGEEALDATYTWSIDSENTKNPEAIEFVDTEGQEWTGQVLKGLVAYQDEELPQFTLSVSVNATSDPNIKVSRTYGIEITTKQFFEYLDELSTNSTSATRCAGMSLAPEVLNLSIKQQ